MQEIIINDCLQSPKKYDFIVQQILNQMKNNGEKKLDKRYKDNTYNSRIQLQTNSNIYTSNFEKLDSQSKKQKLKNNNSKYITQINSDKTYDYIRGNQTTTYIKPSNNLNSLTNSRNLYNPQDKKKKSKQPEPQEKQSGFEQLVKHIIQQGQEEPQIAMMSLQRKQKLITEIADTLKKSINKRYDQKSRQAFEKLIRILVNKQKNFSKLELQKEDILKSRQEKEYMIQKLKKNKQQKIESYQIKRDQDREFQRYFCANILRDEECEQEYLYNVARKYCGRMRSTRLIYIWDKLHKTNIHEYIDNKSHLMFLLLTEEGSRLAAFTEVCFKKPFPEIGFGAIISLSNRKVFTVRPNQRAISYDGTYIIFGKNELLIKGNQLSSNLGNAGGFYDSRGERAQILFNQGSKSNTKIAEMQIFQIEN